VKELAYFQLAKLIFYL